MDAQALVTSVQQAAAAAAEAAQALREANANRSGGFAEANKTVQCPKEFGHAISTEDSAGWADFSFAFRQWLCFADDKYTTELKHVEDNSEVVVTFADSEVGRASKARSCKLYAILSGILKHRPLKVLRQVNESNGFETWRQLYNLYTPKTKVRSLAILSAVMNFPHFVKERTMLEQVQNLERLGDEYRKASGNDISDDIMLTTLVRALPKHIQQHIQLGMDDNSTFQQVKDRVIAYERVSTSWSRDRVLLEFGAGGNIGGVTSYNEGDQGPAAMEVNLLSKGAKGKKGKGKGGYEKGGKGKGSYDKGKGKGKGGFEKGGKGKSFKGYDNSSKGQQKGKQKLDPNVCSYCLKPGHWARDCYKKKAESQVRAVTETTADPKSETATTTSGTAASSSHAVRLVSMQQSPCSPGRSVHFEDLTLRSCPTSPTSPSGVRVISAFDIASTDSDSSWTLSPSYEQHMRAIVNVDDTHSHDVYDVILDSGADTSALPLSFANIGDECPNPNTCFVDAQGAPLTIQSTRIANVQFGDVTFRERFIVSDITCPLLSLGSILRSGWNVLQCDGAPYLVKDGKYIEVLYKNNSLCARGQISVVSQNEPNDAVESIRAVQLGRVLRNLVPGWNKINPHLFAVKTTRPFHVDTTLAPSDEVMWLRTTLVFREQVGWEVIEYCEAISDLRDNLEAEIYDPGSIVEVLTLAHKHAVQDEYLGFFMDVRPPNADAVPEADDDGYAPSIEAVEAPVDFADGEPLEEDRIVPLVPEEDTVVVDGVTMTLDCTLKVLQAGCSSLGLSQRGNKQKCLKRMLDHVKAQTLLAAHGAEVRLRQDVERMPIAQPKPSEPTEQEVLTHSLTHEPFKPWCALCTQYRSRQDPHPASEHERVGHSVISFDIGFCTRMADEVDKQMCLFVHDRDTKMMAAIPTMQKGGRFLQHMVTEVVRFIVATQHFEVGLRSDREPSMLALQDAIKKACRNLGIVCHDEMGPVGDHQTNGAAEVTVQQLRARAGILVQQIEDKVAMGRKIFGCNHPVYCWALVHAGWLHNRFVVSSGLTAYERSCDRSYSGKLAMFGEDVLGYLRTDLKAAPRWQHGIWLGKTMSGDLHIIGQADGVFVTRSIRRNPTPFNLERFAELEHYPWEFGLAALGNRLVHKKRLSQPTAFGVDVMRTPALKTPVPKTPAIDVEAVQVANYAQAHPNEDVDDVGKAGLADDVANAVHVPHTPPRSSSPSPVHGQKRLDAADVASSSAKKARVDAEAAVEDILLDDSEIGASAPKTPRLGMLSAQLVNQVTSTDLELYEHEDEKVSFTFDDQDLERLEEYELSFDDDWQDDNLGDPVNLDEKQIIEQLTFPYTKHEPDVSPDELIRLDALADSMEVKRLVKMHVLEAVEQAGESPKKLSTRFVRTWREKHDKDGKPIWLRRSRLVAREFAWLQPDRDALFSPASSSIVSRLLPTMFLEMREQFNTVMASMDFKDAFLTVRQQVPTLVNCQLADGSVEGFSLGRVLPGQRDGSLMWYKDLTAVLKDDLGMIEHGPYPCILKTPDSSCFVLIHVDDVLVVGRRSFVLDKMLGCLQKKYEVSTQVVEKPGDELSFLKRKMVLDHDGRILLEIHHKHVLQMCSVLGLNKKLQNKKTPGHSDMDMDDETEALSPEAATAFRTCVGILLYLAPDLPHCQHVVRHLSTYSSQPTQKSLVVLKHLVGYLASHDDICISLKWRGRNAGLYHNYNDVDSGECILEVYTDSDWASDRTTRRSVSCAIIMIGGCLLFSSSRTQKLVSLSSAEAEVYACSSGCSDAILLARLISWMCGRKCHIQLYTDSSGARGILQRQGVGRLRHLSCRILWLQNLVNTGDVRVGTVAGSKNPADIGTKRLACSRMRSLMSLLGMFNTTTCMVEGCDDPAGILANKQSIRSILGALSLLTLKGCNNVEVSTDDAGYGFLSMIFTASIGLAILLVMTWYSSQQVNDHVEPDEEPQVASTPVAETDNSAAGPNVPFLPLGALQPLRTQPTPEGMLLWLMERCLRRRDRQVSRERYNMYNERVEVLNMMYQLLTSDDERSRAGAMGMLSNMTDISDDEESPNFNAITAATTREQAERTNDFIRSLNAGSSADHGAETFHALRNAERVQEFANDHDDSGILNESSGDDEDDVSGANETPSERRRRYLSSTMDEVSDPELWADLHY